MGYYKKEARVATDEDIANINMNSWKGLNEDELKDKFTQSDMKGILKSRSLTGYSKMNEDELAQYIVTGVKPEVKKTEPTASLNLDGDDSKKEETEDEEK